MASQVASCFLRVHVGAPLGFHLLPPLVLELSPELPGLIAAHVTAGLEQWWCPFERTA